MHSALNLTAHGSQGPEGTLAVVPDDRLDGGVLGERILAELASNPALLEAPKGDICVQEPGKMGGGTLIELTAARDAAYPYWFTQT